LRESEASLRDANAGLEQFAYAAAHDLQEPIRNVAIYIELLAEKYHDRLDAEANHFIKVATEGAQRMQTLTRDLLTFTRSLDDPGANDRTAESADANRVFDEVVENLGVEIARTQAHVTREIMPPLPMHPIHLLQVLQNLIGNSLRYRGADPPEVHVSARPGDEEWIVSVADNGIGVPVEYQEQIFGIFKRLHGRELPGNGIGLSICARVVNHYQGKIWVRPRSGGGSIFSFTLAAPESRRATRGR
jgi:light-regulated signal transduction histidine kinase (bacteriophytochrome)